MGPGRTTWRLSRKGRRQGSCVVPAWAPGSDGGAPAVGGDDRAGDIAGLRGREEGDDLGDLGGLGGTGEQGRGAEGLDAFGRGPGGQHWSGSDRIDPDPG